MAGRAGDGWSRAEELADRLIGIFSPGRRLRREMARAATDEFASTYRGAGTHRLHGSAESEGSADEDLLSGNQLNDLRRASRDLIREQPIARKARDAFVQNVIGTGLVPQATASAERLMISEAQAEDFRMQAEEVFEGWTAYADAGMRGTFYDLQALAMAQRFENGESFVVLPMVNDGPAIQRRIQLVESDRVDTPGRLKSPLRERVRAGIEIGSRGQPLRYWVKRTHPGERTLSRSAGREDYVGISARDAEGRPKILHVYNQARAGQSRGIPELHAAVAKIRSLGKYLQAEEAAALTAACIAMLITNPHDLTQGYASQFTPEAGVDGMQKLVPGLIKELKPGQDVTAFDPKRPGNTFGPYVMGIQRQVAMAVNLSYGTLTGDYSQSNFSNTRAEIQNDRRFFRCVQRWFSRVFCQPSWRLVLEEAYLLGRLPAAGDDFLERFDEWTRADWIATPGYEWLDPMKDAQASALAVESGFDSTERILRQRGLDSDRVIRDEASYRARRESAGLAPIGAAAPEDDPNEKEEDADAG